MLPMHGGRSFLRASWRCSVQYVRPKVHIMCSTHAASEETGEPEEKSKTWLAAKGLIDQRTGERRKGTNWDYSCELSAFAHRIGFSPKELPSLIQALTPPQTPLPPNPPSMEQDQQDPADSSRLSTLGLTVIYHYVTEYVYCTYEHLDGSSVKAVRSAVTDPDILCNVADHLGVLDLIRTPQNLCSPAQNKLISQSLAAVVGAVYVDRGPLAARGIVHDFLVSQLASRDISDVIKFERPKATLMELLKRAGQNPPQTRLIRESGRATHFPTFVVGVFSGERQLSEGSGSSLKRAEHEALLAALRNHFQEEMKKGPLPSDLETYQDEKDLNLFWRREDKQEEQEGGAEQSLTH